NLVIAGVAHVSDHAGDVIFERAVSRRTTRFGLRKLAGAGELEEPLEHPRPVTAGPRCVDVVRVERAKDDATGTRAGEEYVEPPLAPLAVHRPERHGGEPAVRLTGSVADRDKDHVALVTLHVLDVLHEDVF